MYLLYLKLHYTVVKRIGTSRCFREGSFNVVIISWHGRELLNARFNKLVRYSNVEEGA